MTMSTCARRADPTLFFAPIYNTAMSTGQSEITGPIVFHDSHGIFDAQSTVWSAKNQEAARIVEHQAQCILLVEKDSIFKRLLADDFPATNQCILATDGGYPGRSFRKLLHNIEQQTRLPFYVLADNDPAGYEFFFLIARGGLANNPRERASAIPGAAYLGLRTSDFERMKLHDDATIYLSSAEQQQLQRLASYPWLPADSCWRLDMKEMQKRGFKVEMEATCSLSLEYLAKQFLPQRLGAADLLRLT
jgi:DNA topoisomerase-6 subunit A